MPVISAKDVEFFPKDNSNQFYIFEAMNTFYVPPSAYEWLIPKFVNISVVDEMAAVGEFPTLTSLYPAFVYAVLFGIIRSILQVILFKVNFHSTALFIDHI